MDSWQLPQQIPDGMHQTLNPDSLTISQRDEIYQSKIQL